MTNASAELKSAEAEKSSTSHDLTIGDFREGGLKDIGHSRCQIMPSEILAAIPEPNLQEFYYTVMDRIVSH